MIAKLFVSGCISATTFKQICYYNGYNGRQEPRVCNSAHTFALPNGST